MSPLRNRAAAREVTTERAKAEDHAKSQQVLTAGGSPRQPVLATRLALHRGAATIGVVLALAATGCPGSSGPVDSTGSTQRLSPARTGSFPDARIGGWLVTVYYTVVESYHSGLPISVRGCRQRECAAGDATLGEYSGDFVEAVRAEGTGRITNGPYSGRYLNWSHNVGYWLDDAPRDSRGNALEPFVSAAADADVLAAGANFTIAECGKLDSGEKPPDEVGGRIQSAHWQIRDEFTPGFGGPRHIDIYIGEEQGPDFTSSSWYVSLRNAFIVLG